MKLMKAIALLSIMSLVVIGCKNNPKDKENTVQEKEPVVITDFSGNYVTASYKKRNEGYDWIAVSVKQNSEKEIAVSVCSRADIKKQTCTFDAIAEKMNANTFATVVDGKTILFTFKSNGISITTEKFEDRFILNYYCSGGGSLAGDYEKINEPLQKVKVSASER
ncbi:hypothetical protein V2647_10600 [Tenacibaculum maritimum]|uniref:hypothetical protein n=1 Tax=Tenacibaculum maritimum TaxID=107401 RepID=UPI0012E5AD7E|nr:hypothetical protein [Tenacibaculum maritimum]MDB0601358.1 hypothetical protein [Tenacibaculum maritimum]CAA0152015.1 Probable lipoprotein precursor [Tenacibaculum maritimum]CAA0173624.1 Probable lipoprotein precursor [Tenacibaculum maritimum]CAA0181294.1 Probable lipoprotein precursor [Tenacibaculum maritimum]CAA0183524.1 Probable lipoprotein precursor [Tenacibaculum maritimum]